MNELIMFPKQQTLDSREVADMVEKEHKNIIRDIRGYLDELGELKIEPTDFFTESTYTTEQNKVMPCYEVTLKGCEFIANKLTGIKGTEFTAKYINRFHSMEQSIKTGVLQNLSPELQAIFAHDLKIQDMEHRVDKLETTMTIDYGQQKELDCIRKKRAVTILGGIDSAAYKKISRKVFGSIGHDYKEYFYINAYNNTPAARYEEAKEYLRNWVPDNNLQIEINAANRGLAS